MEKKKNSNNFEYDARLAGMGGLVPQVLQFLKGAGRWWQRKVKIIYERSHSNFCAIYTALICVFVKRGKGVSAPSPVLRNKKNKTNCNACYLGKYLKKFPTASSFLLLSPSTCPLLKSSLGRLILTMAL